MNIQKKVYYLNVSVQGAKWRGSAGLKMLSVGEIECVLHPDKLFRVQDVRLTGNHGGDVEIDYVQVGTTILTAFTSRHPNCHPSQLIRIFLKNKSEKEIACHLEIEGLELEE
jgi:hypothetical protein